MKFISLSQFWTKYGRPAVPMTSTKRLHKKLKIPATVLSLHEKGISENI
jgi:hypothetical protein